MVRCQCTSRICRGAYLGYKQAAGLSYHNEQHPERSAHAPALVSQCVVHDDGGGYPTVRGVLRGIIFHSVVDVDGPVLLRVWIHGTGLHHFSGTCCEITIVLCYFQLCSENHRWWWRSFLTSGSTAFYVFAYSVDYFRRLGADEWFTCVLYFGYMGLICIEEAQAFLLTFLTCGFLACLWFTGVCARASRSTTGLDSLPSPDKIWF